jgi:hypothetical protein
VFGLDIVFLYADDMNKITRIYLQIVLGLFPVVFMPIFTDIYGYASCGGGWRWIFGNCHLGGRQDNHPKRQSKSEWRTVGNASTVAVGDNFMDPRGVGVRERSFYPYLD